MAMHTQPATGAGEDLVLPAAGVAAVVLAVVVWAGRQW